MIKRFLQFNESVDNGCIMEIKSDYQDGLSEGIVVKTSEGGFLKDTWKVVNKYFERREDFNTCLVKNKIVSL